MIMRSFRLQTYVALSCIVALLAHAGSVCGAAGVLFSTLQQTIFIEARIKGQNTTTGVAIAGEDTLIIKWGLNTELPPSVDDDYVDVKLKFCFAPESQKDRGWRNTQDDLHKDKTCQVSICSHPWYSVVGNGSVWKLGRDIPGGTYFVRIYATDRNGKELGYGQTTDRNKTTNFITVQPFSGRSATIDFAATICSFISLGSLLSFFAFETLNRVAIGTPSPNQIRGK